MNMSRIKWFVGLSIAVVASSALVGCGGGDDGGSVATTTPVVTDTLLAVQTGQQSALFYGNTNHKKLGSVTNARVFDPANPGTVLASSDDIMATNIGRPQPSTALVGYNSADNTYTDLYVDTLYYVKGGAPKRVSMKSGHDMTTHTDLVPTETAHSNATGLTVPAYTEVNYLGTKRFLIAKDVSGGQVIVFPAADGTNIPVPFVNKTLLTVRYAAYGQAATGIVLYDSSSFKFRAMTPPITGCSACGVDAVDAQYTDFAGPTLTAASKYAFLGDIGGTATSALIVDGKLYVMNKATLTITEKPVTPSGTATTLADLLGTSGKGSYKLFGDSVFYLLKSADGKTANIYRVNLTSGALTQLTQGHGTSGTVPTKFLSATDDWVLYGTDGLILAVKKSADKASPTLLAENTKTFGIRYPFHFGIGADYLYVTYSVNATTGKTTYKACVFNAGGVTTCRDNSFWSNVSAARKGKLNFTSDYPYTPYAYVRVDDTDDFGGGTLKAVDPVKPLDDGFAMGKVPTFNFNTFMHSFYYHKTTIDTEGHIVIYGKRDDNFVGDAFLVNLLKANSVKNLTSEAAPSVAEINGGDLHCHGRYCSTCHNFAGGKIYGDAAGSVEAVGYNMKFEFADGTSKLARLGKGKGENFNLLHSDIKGEFTPVIVTANGLANEVKRGAKLGHSGLSYGNCDYCHAKSGLLYGAPAVINIVK
ncbi:MAG: hypothetical protein Q8O38_12960 [Sulfurimicrobium sp.]|nr:hypothetical protein [Sulfurimicrobium sp.]